jgi:hypothetical protein
LAVETIPHRRAVVGGIVAVEVAGSPTNPDRIAKSFADRIFAFCGDNNDLRPMANGRAASAKMLDTISSTGGGAEVTPLSKLGIRGTSHRLTKNDDENT